MRRKATLEAVSFETPEIRTQPTFDYESITIYDEKGDIEVRRTSVRDLESKRALLMGPGCSTNIHVQNEGARLMAGEGNEVWTFNNRTNNQGDADAAKLETFQTVFDNVSSLSESPVAVLAHSQNGLIATRMYRDKIEAGEQDELGSLVLIASAGLTEPVSRVELAKNSALEVASHLRDTNFLRGMGRHAFSTLLNNARYAYANHLHLLDEVNSIAKGDIKEDIKFIREAGVPVGIVACAKDRIFPITQMHITGIQMEAEHGVLYSQVPTTHARFLASEKDSRVVADMFDALESSAPQNIAS